MLKRVMKDDLRIVFLSSCCTLLCYIDLYKIEKMYLLKNINEIIFIIIPVHGESLLLVMSFRAKKYHIKNCICVLIRTEKMN